MYIDCIVESVNNDKTVLLKADCASSCEGCKGELFCKQKDSTFSAKNEDYNLKKGDRIRVYLPKKKTILYTLFLFILPIIIMGIFLYLGNINVISTPLSALLAALGCLITFLSMYLYNRKNDKNNLPVVVEVYDRKTE